MKAVRTVSETDVPGLSLIHRGKVRDIFEVDERRLLLVATDRISAFDCIMPDLIPHKGSVLTRLSAFWFRKTEHVAANHLITTDIDEAALGTSLKPELRGRSMLVKRTEVFPVECVVRGYLEGSGLRDYRRTSMICGHRLPGGLSQCERLPEPLFTPATKAAEGHDENITEEEFAEIVGKRTAAALKRTAIGIYETASAFALTRGIIIADTKFEFGVDADGNILLIDEVLTPDSSRFWPAESYAPGRAQPSFDKQYLREHLETLGWNKRPPAPRLPPEVIEATTERYLEAFRMLTGGDADNS